jgi:hypothetical protein
MTTLPENSQKLADHDPSDRCPPLALPVDGENLQQDEEWFLVKDSGRWRELRLHDYDKIYRIPGLYEKLIYDLLGCRSPSVVRALMHKHLPDAGLDPADLRLLDLGAGNGIVGQEFAAIGASRIIGADIHPEAEAAAHRDRPGVYDDFIIGDITALSDEQRDRLRQDRLNALTCVAALGFGDIPPAVFVAAFNLVQRGAIVGFTIKEDFLENKDETGFSALINRMAGDGVMDVKENHRFQHRTALDGKPLFYHAIVGIKHRDVSDELLDEISD